MTKPSPTKRSSTMRVTTMFIDWIHVFWLDVLSIQTSAHGEMFYMYCSLQTINLQMSLVTDVG